MGCHAAAESSRERRLDTHGPDLMSASLPLAETRGHYAMAQAKYMDRVVHGSRRVRRSFDGVYQYAGR